MGGSDDNELSLTSNIGGCGVIGAVYGGVKAAWALAPTAKAPDAQIIYSEVANTIGKTALQFALVGGLFTAGSQVSAMFRQTNDSANYGVGGACVGAYSGLRSGGGRLHMVVVKAIAFGVFGTAVATIARSKSNPAGSAHVSHILSMRFPTALNASSGGADKSSH